MPILDLCGGLNAPSGPAAAPSGAAVQTTVGSLVFGTSVELASHATSIPIGPSELEKLPAN